MNLRRERAGARVKTPAKGSNPSDSRGRGAQRFTAQQHGFGFEIYDEVQQTVVQEFGPDEKAEAWRLAADMNKRDERTEMLAW